MPWVYIIECSDASYYTGSTWDLDARITQHQLGAGAVYTSTRTPVLLRFCMETESIREAYDWERRIHGWSRAKKVALIEGRLNDLPGLSRNRQGEIGGE